MNDANAEPVLAGGVVEGFLTMINSSVLYSSDSEADGKVSEELGNVYQTSFSEVDTKVDDLFCDFFRVSATATASSSFQTILGLDNIPRSDPNGYKSAQQDLNARGNIPSLGKSAQPEVTK